MIVVSSVDLDSSQSSSSQRGDFIDVSALGTGIHCTSNRFDNWVTEKSTSFTAPAVAGLAACFLSSNLNLQRQGLVAKKVKDHITSLAWL
jgi:subtilisin family serine protease